MKNTKDFGTYFLRVEFLDGTGFIQKWETGYSYCGGRDYESALDAMLIPPAFECEEELFDAMIWQYSNGNYSCDCNKMLFLQRANHKPETETKCGDEMELKSLTIIRPDRSEVVFQLHGFDALINHDQS